MSFPSEGKNSKKRTKPSLLPGGASVAGIPSPRRIKSDTVSVRWIQGGQTMKGKDDSPRRILGRLYGLSRRRYLYISDEMITQVYAAKSEEAIRLLLGCSQREPARPGEDRSPRR